MVDKHLIQAEQLLEKRDYVGAFKEMNKIVALQKEHNLTLPEAFLSNYVQIALKAGEPQTTLDAMKKYLVTAGKKGEFYKEALVLLNKAEQAAQILPLEPEMVVIPEGRFQMGCVSGKDYCYSDERPVHAVRIDSFALSKYEVIFEEYDAFTDATGRERVDDVGSGRGRRPVFNVSWHDAVAYTQWLSSKTGKTYRLPSEAEWEYAARAGSTTNYSWGDGLGYDHAYCRGCNNQWSGLTAPEVGSFSANRWGLHDMHGNVAEWVQDCWNQNYRGAPTDGSAWESGECGKRVLRGGSWDNEWKELRSAYRSRSSTEGRSGNIGFRVARSF